MPPDRWEEINRIYNAALEVAEGERPVFVREACQGDDELHPEVELERRSALWVCGLGSLAQPGTTKSTSDSKVLAFV